MQSHQELLDMVATEAIEVSEPLERGVSRQGYVEVSSSPLGKRTGHYTGKIKIDYDLRLVRYEDGRLEWKD